MDNTKRGGSMNPILIHIPHSSTYIPAADREMILLPDTAIEDEILAMTDHYVDELFDVSGYDRHINAIMCIIFMSYS